jgi:o-succinylbenzoate synthase
MKIDSVELVHVSLPLASAFQSGVAVKAACESLLVRVKGEGVSGWGEVVADTKPSYAPETLVTAKHVLKEFLLPAVLGKTFESIDAALASFAWVRGHPMAKAGLELALWDWWGRATKTSLSTLLGGTKTQVDVGVSVGLARDEAELRATLERFHGDGYRRFKLKITPTWLEVPLRVAREVLQEAPLAADANGTFTPEHTARLQASGPLQFLEQPLAWDDLVLHAALKRAVAPPLALDESVSSWAQLEAAIALDALDVVNVKPGRIGGLSLATRCLTRARQAGLGTFVGGMLETAIGRAGNVALASLQSVTLPSDLSATARYFETDVGSAFVLREGSRLDVPTAPGLGVEVDEGALRRFTLASEFIA